MPIIINIMSMMIDLMILQHHPQKESKVSQLKMSLRIAKTTHNIPKVLKVSPDEIEWYRRQSQLLEGAAPEEILTWAVDRYFPRFTMVTGLGPEGCLIISMLAKIEPHVYVFNLDTGYQFPETLELRDRIAEKYGIVVDLQRPELSVEEYEATHSGPLYHTDPDQCCRDRKIAVLNRVVEDFDAWASGIRRDQSACRADTPVIRWDGKFGLVKVSPLATWTKRDVWKRIVQDKVPYNPLHDRGYPSIGCQPCTRSVMDGEDERAGRWSGTAKTECGLHME
jgi:phosphoadenosine phosphosulfate reductase